jgi:sulfur carrier protein
MIQLNNRPMEYEPDMTIKSLIKKMKFTHPMLIVRINGVLIEEALYADTPVQDGDDVKIIHPIAGG